jgi:hypothetical protein
MRKDATFAAPASATTGLAAHDLEGQGRNQRRLARLAARRADPSSGETRMVLRPVADVNPITSEVFNDLEPPEAITLRPGWDPISEIPVADTDTIVDVVSALEQCVPAWRIHPETLPLVAVPRGEIVALQAGVKAEKVAGIQAKAARGDRSGPRPVGVQFNGRTYVRDGHHRTIAELRDGAKAVEMRVAVIAEAKSLSTPSGGKDMTTSAFASDIKRASAFAKGFGVHGFWNGTEPHRGGGGGGAADSARDA